MGGKIIKMKGGRQRRQMSSKSLKRVWLLSLSHKAAWIILLIIVIFGNEWEHCTAFKRIPALHIPGDITGDGGVDDGNLTLSDLPRIRLLNLTNEFGDVSFRDGSSPLTKSLFQNDTVYMVPNSRNFLSFECAAKYPIFWNLGHADIHPSMYHAVKVMSIRKFQDPYDPSTFQFKSMLTLNGPAPKLSGNYSCQSTARHYIQSSILIFWESSSGGEFVHSKENLTVSVTSLREEIRLPCQLTDPDSHPKLEKEIDASKDSYEQLHLNDSIGYLNGAGYILKNLPNPLGTYKCLLDEKEFVSVRVVQKNETHLKDYVFLYDEDRKQVKCCVNGNMSNARKPPKMYMMDCQHPSTCAIRENLPLESLSQSGYFWNQGRRRGNCAVYNLHTIHTGVLRCVGNGFSSYKEFIAPIEPRRLGWHEKRNTTTFFRWEEIDPQAMIVVTTMNPGDDIYAFDRMGKPQQKQKIIYSNQNVQLTCHTSRYYFASGTYWMIRWKNQTLTQIDDDSKNGRQVLDDLRYYVDRERHMNTVFVTAQPDVDSVICFAPVWNSSVWISKIHHLYVNDSMAPLIQQDTVERVNYTWYANETDKTLSCIGTGLPAPTFHWEKDNITILPSTHNYNVLAPNVSGVTNTTTTTTTTTTPPTTTTTTEAAATTTHSSINATGTADSTNNASSNNNDDDDKRSKPVGATSQSSLQISRVSFNTQGVFRCVASNVGGRATKEFYITVLEVKSWKVTGMLVGASIITVVLIGGIIYLLKKLYADRQEINQLGNNTTSFSSSSVNFNDVMSTTDSNGGSHHGIRGNSNNSSTSRNTGLGFGSRLIFSLRNNTTSNNNGSNNTTANTNNGGSRTGGGVGVGSGGDSANHSVSYDNGLMTNNLIDTF